MILKLWKLNSFEYQTYLIDIHNEDYNKFVNNAIPMLGYCHAFLYYAFYHYYTLFVMAFKADTEDDKKMITLSIRLSFFMFKRDLQGIVKRIFNF